MAVDRGRMFGSACAEERLYVSNLKIISHSETDEKSQTTPVEFAAVTIGIVAARSRDDNAIHRVSRSMRCGIITTATAAGIS